MPFRLSPRSILSLTIAVGAVIVGLRANDVWDEVSSGRLFAHPAMAETAPATPAIEPPKLAAPSTDTSSPKAPMTEQATAPAPAPAASDIIIPDDASPAEIEILKQLSNRRQELEKHSRELDTREALIKVAEQRVDQKIKDMETLRKQLQSMVNQVSETQAAQLDNLVKIYETMKPKEAARIFEALDMPILLSVIQRMKPARTAPIMAEMNPDKAKEVTTALTKQDKLPQIK